MYNSYAYSYPNFIFRYPCCNLIQNKCSHHCDPFSHHETPTSPAKLILILRPFPKIIQYKRVI